MKVDSRVEFERELLRCWKISSSTKVVQVHRREKDTVSSQELAPLATCHHTDEMTDRIVRPGDTILAHVHVIWDPVGVIFQFTYLCDLGPTDGRTDEVEEEERVRDHA